MSDKKPERRVLSSLEELGVMTDRECVDCGAIFSGLVWWRYCPDCITKHDASVIEEIESAESNPTESKPTLDAASRISE